ncbi:uncharacterized protein LOC141655896 [Silene latifolia]|uniref:uncharacterized protein LOC141655896 n=1 Tax=Silene latifolia TaxID=37657 RepID=UPI003D785A5B
MKLRSHSALPQAKNGVVAPHKRRKVEKRNIYLPRDVIFNILLHRPAKLLYEVVKYVCKQWYDIVNDPSFIKAHCQMPTTTTTSASFIIQSRNNQHEVYCAEQVTAKSFKENDFVLRHVTSDIELSMST